MRIAIVIVGWLLVALGIVSSGDKPAMVGLTVAGAVLVGSVVIGNSIRGKCASRLVKEDYPAKEAVGK